MLKRVCVIIASILLIVGLFFFNKTPAFKMLNKYEVYFTNYSESKSIKSIDKSHFKLIFGLKGECVEIDRSDFCLDKFLKQLDAQIFITEKLADVVCYYGYSPKIKYLEMLNGRLINIHIAISQSYVKIGAPIIYGSF